MCLVCLQWVGVAGLPAAASYALLGAAKWGEGEGEGERSLE